MTLGPHAAVVGLDPSLRATGIALPDGTLHTITQDSQTTLPDRVARLRRILGQVTQLVPPHSLVMIEGPALGMGNKATHELGGLWWCLVVRLAEMGCTPVVVGIQQVKKLATGRGTGVSKADMRVALLRRTGRDVPDDNQVDAWWLREAGRQLVGHPDALTLPQAHLEALTHLELPEEP